MRRWRRRKNLSDDRCEQYSHARPDIAMHDGACFRALGSRSESQPFSSITSVDLITAETLSPTFNFISSALRLVITLSIKCLPTRITT